MRCTRKVNGKKWFATRSAPSSFSSYHLPDPPTRTHHKRHLINFTFIDQYGEITRTMKKAHLAMFGKPVTFARCVSRPPLSQSGRCHKLGHISNRCSHATRLLWVNVRRSNARLYSILSSNKHADLILVQEPWFNRIGTARSDFELEGICIFGTVANPLWEILSLPQTQPDELSHANNRHAHMRRNPSRLQRIPRRPLKRPGR